MSENPPQSFISYSRDDERLVVPVVKLLQSVDAAVFFDLESLRPGDKWEAKIEQALIVATSVFVFWCKHAEQSDWVRKESEIAMRLGKRVIPVLLDNTPLWEILRPYQWIDFRDVTGGRCIEVADEAEERAAYWKARATSGEVIITNSINYSHWMAHVLKDCVLRGAFLNSAPHGSTD